MNDSLRRVGRDEPFDIDPEKWKRPVNGFSRKEPPAGPHPDGGWCSACDIDPEFHFDNPPMSEYTPTTEEVRENVAYPLRVFMPITGPEFDRWLRQVKAEAWDEGLMSSYNAPIGPNPYREEQ